LPNSDADVTTANIQDMYKLVTLAQSNSMQFINKNTNGDKPQTESATFLQRNFLTVHLQE